MGHITSLPDALPADDNREQRLIFTPNMIALVG